MQASSEIFCPFPPVPTISHPLLFARVCGNVRHSHILHTLVQRAGPYRRLEKEVVIILMIMRRLSTTSCRGQNGTVFWFLHQKLHPLWISRAQPSPIVSKYFLVLFFFPSSLAKLPSCNSSPVHDIWVVGTMGHTLNLLIGHLSRGKIPLWTLLARLFQLQRPLQQYTITQKKK